MRTPPPSPAAGAGSAKLTTLFQDWPVLAGCGVAVLLFGLLLHAMMDAYILDQAEKRVQAAMMECRALHLYVQRDMHPNYFRLMQEGRLPQGFYAPELLSSSFIVRHLQRYYNEERSKENLPEISYKMAAINPRNPINLADAEEKEILRWFDEDPGRTHYRRDYTEGGHRYLLYATPFLRFSQRCLTCHGKPEDAPARLQAIYKWTGGFNREVGELAAVEIVRTPIESRITPLTVTGFLVPGLLGTGLFLAFFNKRLRHKVATTTRDLRIQHDQLVKAKEAAEAASLAKSEFLANMSHELRTPLNGVLGMLQLLGGDPSIADGNKVLLETAMESGRGLLAIVTDILSFAQLNAGKLNIAHEPADVREIVDSLCRAFQYEASEKRLELACAVDGSIPGRVCTDAGRVRQILLNLIANAIKFTAEGRIAVDVSLLPHQPAPEERVLLVTVSDTGIGIPDDKQTAIFEPFTQVDGSLTRKFQGTGIGLGIVRQLARLMGGEVCIDSTLGQGTTVYVTLRCRTSTMPARAAAAPPATEHPHLPGLRVLVAEDDRVNLFTATRFLERLGCSATGAGDGREVLDRMASADFDCVLMDVQMPVLDGLETTLAIRSCKELGSKARIPIVAMTAHAMPGDRERFLAAGMDGYISKPVDLAELEQVLTEIAARLARKN